MVIFCADESGCDAELVGTSVSIPRGSRASSLWAGAKVGAVMKTAARKNRYIICMCRLLKPQPRFLDASRTDVNVRALLARQGEVATMPIFDSRAES